MPRKLTDQEFIHKARKTHGEKYDYSRMVYKNNRTKITIVCPYHGEFLQYTSGHISGKGCPSCAVERRTGSTWSFLEKAKSIHGDKYGYNLVSYVTDDVEVRIICHEHGEFSQRPSNHLAGRGCKSCASVRIGDLKRNTTESFLIRSREVHGDKYGYEHALYEHCDSKVKIICREHGEFEQKASHHLSGQGCPCCCVTGYDPSKAGFLYALRSLCGNLVKIGISNKPKARHKVLEKKTPFDFYVFEEIKFSNGLDARRYERHFHQAYESAGFSGFDGATEWLVCTPELLEEIRSIANGNS